MRRAILFLPVAGAMLLAVPMALLRPYGPGLARQRAEAAAVPAGFAYVPGGECWIGTNEADAEEDARPMRRAFVGSFYIGREEVSQAEWKHFRPDFVIAPGRKREPITGVSYEDAAAYARFVGGRLPSDLEWEKAARGTDGRRYPWGDHFDPRLCNVREGGQKLGNQCSVAGHGRHLKAVDAYPGGASPYGVLNMAGNAWEWVSGYYQGDRSKRIIRGGASGYGERSARAYARGIEGAGVT